MAVIFHRDLFVCLKFTIINILQNTIIGGSILKIQLGMVHVLKITIR